MQLVGGVPRWRNAFLFKIPFFQIRSPPLPPPTPIWPSPSTQQLASFHSTPPSLAKWKPKPRPKFNSDTRDHRSSKTHFRFVTREKRADSKRDLRNLIFNYNSDNFSFEKSRMDEDQGHQANDSDFGAKKDQSKRRIRSHYKKMKRKQKRESFDDAIEQDMKRTFQAMFGNRCNTWYYGKQREESHSQDSTSGFEWRENSYRTRSRNDKWANESDEESDDESYVLGSSSDRTLLGLPASGPLKIEEVKNAFRLSALKWHPDKHQGGSGQAVAEEKFKCCVTAYKSLCSALASA